jgi:hypothetical protein
MFGRMTSIGVACVVAALAFSPADLRADLSFTGSSISENFNSLPTTTQTNLYPHGGDHEPVPGTGFDAAKYAGDPGGGDGDLIADNGSSTTPGLFSYGATASGERALGSLGHAGMRMAYGFVLTNDSSTLTITSITVSFTQESWRAGHSANTIPASWSTSDVGGAPTPTNYLTAATGFTNVTALDLTLAGVGGSGTTLDGNLAGNQAAKTFTFTALNLVQNDQFFLRWRELEEAGNDAGLAIDNMNITFTTSAIPEPSAFLFGGIVSSIIGLAAGWRRLRARAQQAGN